MYKLKPTSKKLFISMKYKSGFTTSVRFRSGLTPLDSKQDLFGKETELCYKYFFMQTLLSTPTYCP